jgi:uncharacterized coiled-coil protein SlyX
MISPADLAKARALEMIGDSIVARVREELEMALAATVAVLDELQTQVTELIARVERLEAER